MKLKLWPDYKIYFTATLLLSGYLLFTHQASVLGFLFWVGVFTIYGVTK